LKLDGSNFKSRQEGSSIRIQAKAVGQEVLTALSPGEQVIKIVRDELVENARSNYTAK